MDEFIIDALSHEPDFSPSFTSRIGVVRDQLQRRFCIRLEHESNMNYAAAQRLEYRKRSAEEESEFAIDLFLSSRASAFATGFRRSLAVSEWEVVSRKDVPADVQHDAEKFELFLTEIGWRFVDEEQSQEYIVGRTTLMDKAPATVFDVLFTELR